MTHSLISAHQQHRQQLKPHLKQQFDRSNTGRGHDKHSILSICVIQCFDSIHLRTQDLLTQRKGTEIQLKGVLQSLLVWLPPIIQGGFFYCSAQKKYKEKLKHQNCSGNCSSQKILSKRKWNHNCRYQSPEELGYLNFFLGHFGDRNSSEQFWYFFHS